MKANKGHGPPSRPPIGRYHWCAPDFCSSQGPILIFFLYRRFPGAGVSGVTSAKAMLEQGFQPTLFDSKPHIGGLWSDPPSSPSHPFLIPRAMRTNLSKFTCAFSDFSWKDASFSDELPTGFFPRADDVSTYLKKYWLKFAKDATLRLGCNVVSLSPERVDEDGAPLSWAVEYDDTNGERRTETYDYVVIGTGFNSAAYTPHFQHRNSFKGRVLHASEYTWHAIQSASQASPFSQKKIVVVGGSLTAAELVGEIALAIASLPAEEREKYALIHMFSRPFWITPKTIPLLVDKDTRCPSRPVLLPMDWIFYNLKDTDKPSNINEYLKVLVGGDQSDLTPELTITPEAMNRIPWVCLSNAYAGFARSGAVNTLIGRLLEFSAEDPYTLTYDFLDADHSLKCISEVSCVVMSTGYTPYHTLQKFLDPGLFKNITSPEEDKPTDYAFLPFLLYKQVLHPAFGRTGGCVGLYKGPYFAVMELQAKWLAALFAGNFEWPSREEQENGKDGINDMRNKRNNRTMEGPAERGQWSWGQYVTIVQDLCKTLNIEWHKFSELLVDPFAHERLLPVRPTPQTSELQRLILDIGSRHNPVFVPSAVFRALQGKWNVGVRYSIERMDGDGHAAAGNYTAQALFAGEGRTDLPASDRRVDPATVQQLRYSEIGRNPHPEGVVCVLQQNPILYRLDLAPLPSISLSVTLPTPDSENITFSVPLKFGDADGVQDGGDDDEQPAWRARAELGTQGDGILAYQIWLDYAFWFNGTDVRTFKVKLMLKGEAGLENVQSIATYTR
jgi:hypothetical protein